MHCTGIINCTLTTPFLSWATITHAALNITEAVSTASKNVGLEDVY